MDAPHELCLLTGAKVNLLLRVVGRRSDGYHEIESIFHTLDLVDDLTIEPVITSEITVEMRGADGFQGDMPGQADNLVYRAAHRLRDLFSVAQGAAISITKRIPIAAGLGGGSSNAAGALVGLAELWELDVDRDTMLRLASEVGSDVAYCLVGGTTALVTGRGEKVAALPPPPTKLWFVLGISNDPLMTAEVYARVETSDGDDLRSTAPMTMALGAGDVADVASLLYNDLEPAAFRLRPALKASGAALLEAGALGVSLSGSGPTLFGVAEDERHARSIAVGVERAFDRVVVASSAPSCVVRL